ncbi:hypothetical protein D4R51_04140 [bacterium]|nr:MAG: hypothetical protein D4R51_04140 [bacterium]
MKRILILSLVIFFGLLSFSARPVFADSGSSTVQKALENTKQFLDDLVTAKDESTGDDLNLRIKTFRQVLDLSETEAKDFAFKLLAVEKDEKLETWKKNALNKIDGTISFIGSQKVLVSDGKSPDLAKMKQIAQDFKLWRDANYLPLVGQIQDFLLIKQEAKSIQTAQNRLSKITGDLKGLNRTKISGSSEIKKLLDNSKSSVIGAADLNNQAYKIFLKNYEDSIATSSIASSTIPDAGNNMPSSNQAEALATSTAVVTSSTTAAASSTAVAGFSNPPIVSIKDLVKSSLSKIKDAYQGFIDISNLVRKLLG